METSLYELISVYGLLAIAICMLGNGSVSFPPSEVVLALGGMWAVVYDKPLLLVIGVAVVANLTGAYILYRIGERVGTEWVLSLRKRVLQLPKWMAYAGQKVVPSEEFLAFLIERFRSESGVRWIAILRCLPLVRSVISLPAGAVRVQLSVFLAYSALGMTVWAIGWALFGYVAAESWMTYKWMATVPLTFALAVILLLFARLTSTYAKSAAIEMQTKGDLKE